VLQYREDWPVPSKLLPTQMLVRMFVAGVAPVDAMIRSGKFKLVLNAGMPYIPGVDGSGVVVKTGSQVSKFKIGDEVFGYLKANKSGAYAQYCVFDEKEMALKPSKLTHQQAAGIPINLMTAHVSLVVKGHVKKGDRVLVIGASGGVGSLGVQYAKVLGCYVIGVCSQKNVEWVQSLGVDQVIDYTKEKYADVLKNEEDKVDIVFDSIGDSTAEKQAFQVLKSKGRFVSCATFNPMKRLAGFLGMHQTYVQIKVPPNLGEDLTKLSSYFQDGAMKPVTNIELPLEKASESHKMIETKRTRGKIVLNIPSK